VRRRKHRPATSDERVHQDGAAKTLQEGLPESGGISPGVESISSWSAGNRQPQRTTAGHSRGPLFSMRNTSLFEWNTGTPLREKFQKISGTHPDCGSFSSAKVALPRVGGEVFNGRSDCEPHETWGSASLKRGTHPGWRRVMSRWKKHRSRQLTLAATAQRGVPHEMPRMGGAAPPVVMFGAMRHGTVAQQQGEGVKLLRRCQTAGVVRVCLDGAKQFRAFFGTVRIAEDPAAFAAER
jgi:hypothetical protein